MVGRQSPKSAAREHNIGTKRKGMDGKMWKVVKTAAGVKRWQRSTAKKAVKKGPKKGAARAKPRRKAAPKKKDGRKVKAGERKCSDKFEVLQRLDGTYFQYVPRKDGKASARRKCKPNILQAAASRGVVENTPFINAFNARKTSRAKASGSSLKAAKSAHTNGPANAPLMSREEYILRLARLQRAAGLSAGNVFDRV